MTKRMWLGWMLAWALTACGGDDKTLFVAVTADGPGTARVLFDEVAVLDGASSLEWNPEQVTSVFSKAERARRCERSGAAGICVTLKDGASTNVSIQGLPDASPLGELDVFERRTQDALRGCQESPFDSTRLECRVQGGAEIFVELVFRPVQEFRALGVGVEGKGVAEAAVFRQPALRADLLTSFVTGFGAAQSPVRFRATPAEGEVFVEWTGDCRGRSPEFDSRLDFDLRCTAHFRSEDTTLPGLCAEDERVESGACVACPTGAIKPAGDDPNGTDTTCIAPLCAADERVEAGQCVACTAGETNQADDNPRGPDTTCDGPRCPTDFRVQAGACVRCGAQEINDAGDDPTGPDTVCDQAETPPQAPPGSPPPTDACAVNNGGCDANATCSESGGAVQCQCRPGFVGDGIICQPAGVSVSLPQTTGVPATCQGRGYDFQWIRVQGTGDPVARLGSRIWIPGAQTWEEDDSAVRVYDASAGWVDCTPLPDSFVSSVHRDGTGGWILGGDFDTIGGQPCSGWVRLNDQLEIDVDFCQALPPGLSNDRSEVEGGVLYAVGESASGSRLFALELETNVLRFPPVPLVDIDSSRGLSVGDDHVVVIGHGLTEPSTLAAFDKITGASVGDFPVIIGSTPREMWAVGTTAFVYFNDAAEIRGWDIATRIQSSLLSVSASPSVLTERVGGRYFVQADPLGAEGLGTDDYFEVFADGSVARWNLGDPSLTRISAPDLGITDSGVVRVTLDPTTRTINPTGPEFEVPESGRIRVAVDGSRLLSLTRLRSTFNFPGALLDPTTGALEPIVIENDGQIEESAPVASDHENLVAVWGTFSTVGGQSRDGFALVELTETGPQVLDFTHPAVPRPVASNFRTRRYAFFGGRLYVRENSLSSNNSTFAEYFSTTDPGAGSSPLPGLTTPSQLRANLSVTSRGLIAHGGFFDSVTRDYDIYDLQPGTGTDPTQQQAWADQAPFGDIPTTFLGEAGGQIFFGPAFTVFDAATTRLRTPSLPFDQVASVIVGMAIDGDTLYLAGSPIVVNGESRLVVAMNAQTFALLDWNPPEITRNVRDLTVFDDRIVVILPDGSGVSVDKASP